MAKIWKEVRKEPQWSVSLQPHLRLILPPSFPCSTCRRLLTQLEAAKGSRGGAVGDGKPASAKGPDGVVLYELHSRPEQEKFTESAKVGRMNASAGLACVCFLTPFLVLSWEKMRGSLMKGGKAGKVCVGPRERCCLLCCVSVDCGVGEASCRAGDISWLWIRQTGTQLLSTITTMFLMLHKAIFFYYHQHHHCCTTWAEREQP